MTAIVSPHLDDAIFSIPLFLKELRSATIITPFGGIPEDDAGYIKYKNLLYEHDNACYAMSIKYINGPFLDDVYPTPDVFEFREWFKKQLKKHKSIYLPIGIHHPDHKLVCRTLLDVLQNSGFNGELYFYEELPYRVLYPDLTTARIKELSNAYPEMTLIEKEIDRSFKEPLVKLYESQTKGEIVEQLLVNERVWRAQ